MALSFLVAGQCLFVWACFGVFLFAVVCSSFIRFFGFVSWFFRFGLQLVVFEDSWFRFTLSIVLLRF
jgi:hypothetical protein